MNAVQPSPTATATTSKASRKLKAKNRRRADARGDGESDDVVLLLQTDAEDTRVSKEHTTGSITIAVGDRVSVHSLKLEPQYNGAEGIVVSHAQASGGARYNVACDGIDGRRFGLCVRQEHLLRVVDNQTAMLEEGGADLPVSAI